MSVSRQKSLEQERSSSHKFSFDSIPAYKVRLLKSVKILLKEESRDLFGLSLHVQSRSK